MLARAAGSRAVAKLHLACMRGCTTCDLAIDQMSWGGEEGEGSQGVSSPFVPAVCLASSSSSSPSTSEFVAEYERLSGLLHKGGLSPWTDQVPHTQLALGAYGRVVRHTQPPCVLQAWECCRCDVVERRARFNLGKAEKRRHLVEGFLAALTDLDQIVKLIRAADDGDPPTVTPAPPLPVPAPLSSAC